MSIRFLSGCEWHLLRDLVVAFTAAVGVGLVTGSDRATDGPVPAPSTTERPAQPLGSLLPPRPTR